MPLSTLPRTAKPASKLDRAIIASVAVMTIFVLSQQLSSAPKLAAAPVLSADNAITAQQA